MAKKKPKRLRRRHHCNDPTVLESLGRRVAQRRYDLGLTQQDLADLTDFTRVGIAMLETRTFNPSVEALIRLCDMLECSADWLLGRSERKGS